MFNHEKGMPIHVLIESMILIAFSTDAVLLSYAAAASA
jgi:hypothetical protein